MKVDKNRSRLGRGISSLISSAEFSDGKTPALPVMRETTGAPVEGLPSDSPHIVQLPIDAISPNPHQPRREIDPVALAELAASIRATGLIQPITVRAIGDKYQLIAGERRWRASRLAGMQSIPAIVHLADNAEQAEMALIENIQRQDLNPIDRATCYRNLMDQLGVTQAELAERLGEERSGIANHLRLLNLVEPVRQLLLDNKLTLGHAKLLAGIDDMLEQQRLADMVVHSELSVRNLERAIQQTDRPPTPRKSATSPHLRDLETTLTAQLQMRVNVQTVGTKGGGRVTFHYTSLDQFDEIMKKLGAQLPET